MPKPILLAWAARPAPGQAMVRALQAPAPAQVASAAVRAALARAAVVVLAVDQAMVAVQVDEAIKASSPSSPLASKGCFFGGSLFFVCVGLNSMRP